ncbi:MAG TPA: SRPBCC domain-containing protein [Methyloceanibacter sp.]|nr:SRPBCC domain-containing protein [Methyloceanibacter sp.]
MRQKELRLVERFAEPEQRKRHEDGKGPLTDRAFTRRYWVNHRNASDWKVGSPWRHEDFDDASLVDIVGKVVESAPPRHLVLTCSFPRDAGNPEKISRVDFNIETYGDAVRLTVT